MYNFDGSYSFAILDVNGNKVDEETLAKLSYQWMRRTFVDPYGNFNGRSFNEWVNDTFGKGNGYYYEGDDTNIVWNAMNKAYSTNDWDSFWDYLEHACSSGTRGSGGGGGCRKTAIGIDIYGNEYVEGGTPSTGYESLDRLLRLRDQTSAYFGRDIC